MISKVFSPMYLFIFKDFIVTPTPCLVTIFIPFKQIYYLHISNILSIIVIVVLSQWQIEQNFLPLTVNDNTIFLVCRKM